MQYNIQKIRNYKNFVIIIAIRRNFNLNPHLTVFMTCEESAENFEKSDT